MAFPPAALSDALAKFQAAIRNASDKAPGGEGLAVVVAHPDDETIGLGGHLHRLRESTIVHLTDGAPRNLRDARDHGFGSVLQYAAARRRELDTAMAAAGVGRERLFAFGVPDGEAIGHAAALARRLADLLIQRQVRLVLTHAYEGGHPDHDAAAIAVRGACTLCVRRGTRPPAMIEMPFYHAEESGPVFQAFPPEPKLPTLDLPLDDEQWARKQRMLACFRTQQQTLAQFTSRTETFRAAPSESFRRAPNGGRLQYEAWGLADGEAWLRAARQELDALGMSWS